MSLRRALILVLLQTLLARVLLIALVAGGVLDAANPFAPTTTAVVLVIAVGAATFVGLVWWGSARAVGRPLSAIGWSGLRPAVDLPLGLAGGAVLVGWTLLALGALSVPVENALEEMASYSLEERLMFGLIGLQAAAVEESLFRGNLFDALQARLGRGGAAVVSTLIFSAYHLQGPVGLLSKVVIGGVLTGLKVLTGRLWAPALAHLLLWLIVGSL